MQYTRAAKSLCAVMAMLCIIAVACAGIAYKQKANGRPCLGITVCFFRLYIVSAAALHTSTVFQPKDGSARTACTTQRVEYPFPVQVTSVRTGSVTVGAIPVRITEQSPLRSSIFCL